MTDTLPDPPDIDPAALAGTGFSRARKGFEPAEVHALLGRTADALRIWQLRDAQLSEQLADLEVRLSKAQELDEERLTEVLGEETARIVSAARDAAAQIRSNAEERAATLLAETEQSAVAAADALRSEAESLRDEAARLRDDAASDATSIRTEAESSAAMTLTDAQARSEDLLGAAESLMATRTAEADEVVASMLQAAELEVQTAAATAATTRVEAEQEAEATVAAARETGRAMVAEAKALRERMLRDLADRRLDARRQIEGALAARDRVADILRAAGGELSAAVDDLQRIDAAASQAADEAAAGIDGTVDTELAALHAELGEPHDVTETLTATESPEPASSDEAALEEIRDETVVIETVVVEGVVVEDEVELDIDPEDGSVVLVETVTTAEVIEIFETPRSDADGSSDVSEVAPDADDEAALVEGDDELDGPDELLEGDDELDGDEDGEGATVHDLFARIRAEGLDDPEAPQDGPATGDTAAASEQQVDDDGPEEGGPEDGGGEPIDLTAERSSTSSAAARLQSAAEGEGGGTDVAVRTDQDLLDRRDELLTPAEKSLSRALKRLASDEQNEMLDKLRRVKRGRPDLADILPAGDAEYAEHYVNALLPEFNQAVEAGAAFWSDVAGSAADSLFGDEHLAAGCLRSRVEQFLSVHRAHLERTFVEADEADLDPSELGDRIRASYRDWRSTTLADLAGDLATAGFTHGERRAAGPGTPWKWVVDNGGLPCADGEDNALAGAVPCEEAFPTGDVTPPAHPGCRCILAPARR